ncbi:Rab3 GTPase-activating protein catalytic subunit [Actinomortierella ambigua]|uniref:Rab3 GTPase-activating protein catalytic subunit n=1 Tax=Actinomortierella ambigua TaxID=1343610 RepID=A0A9P6U259_9FUNG|nr:Rab3 GTPase-activating protein catalytic subunit [Actinomortierella ambigua]
METDDQFEFIDFSAASGWEKFIKSIEDVLVGWDLGGTSPASPPFASPSSSSRTFSSPGHLVDHEKSHDEEEEGGDDGQPSQHRHGPVTDTSRGFQLKELISLEDASYTLSYHYHPAKERMAAGVTKIDLDFLPSSLEGVDHHVLHRWTGLTHLLIVSPVTISDIFASTTLTTSSSSSSSSSAAASSVMIDLSTAKLLLSSFAIAFQNTGCRIPVFVATGQPWNMTFAGLSMQPQSPMSASSSSSFTTHLLQPHRGGGSSGGGPLSRTGSSTGGGSGGADKAAAALNGLEDAEEDQAIEVRFNTILVPYPPVRYAYLAGLLGFFIERMGIEDVNGVLHAPQDHDGDLSRYSFHLKESIHVSAVFSYDLLNWYDEDWRRWRTAEHDGGSSSGGDGVGEEGGDGLGGMRRRSSSQPRDELSDQGSSLNLEHLRVEGKPIRPLSALPFGPVQDPLKSLRLLARFASAPSTMYLDSRSFTDMDASLANIWTVSAAFKDDDYGMLSGILEDALASWTSEIMSSAPSSKMGSEGRAEKQHTYESLLHTGARIIQGTVTMVDATDVENIVQALFDVETGLILQQQQQRQHRSSGGGPGGARKRERITSAVLRSRENRTRLISASELGMHFRHGTTVPVDSFLWRMLQYLVGVISPNSDISYATSIMGFLKVLWSEILKQFYLHWENSELVPLVDMYQHNDVEEEEEEEEEEVKEREEEEAKMGKEERGETQQQDPEKTPAGSDLNTGKNETDQKSAKMKKKKKAKRIMSIDMRFSLLHQKISMLNCCIARQREMDKDSPSHVIPLNRRSQFPLSKNTAGSSAMALSDPYNNQSQGGGGGGGGQLHSLLQGLSEMSRPRSADVVPMAKRLLETARNKGSEVLSSYAGGGNVGNERTGSLSAAVSRMSSPPLNTSTTTTTTTVAPIPVRRGSSGRSRRSRRADDGSTLEQYGEEEEEGEGEEMFFDSMEAGGDLPSPTSSSSSSRQQQQQQQQQHSSQHLHPPRQHRSPSTVDDSFVQLKYSSSAESQSTVLVPSSANPPTACSGGGDDTGTGTSAIPDPREVKDPEAREGALEPFKDLKLLETGAPMMVPKLQEYGFMTEDMIQQQEELFETLGSSSDGAKTRAKIQSSQLVSDMEAFKAANPGCVLGDFIRWHSPKDWDEAENKMSARMADSGNYWQELWASAKRIPANRQTLLFNHNQEAAKALFYLDSLSANQLFVQLLPSICLIAYDTLVSHPVASHVRQVAEKLRDLAQALTEFGWNELAATSEDKHLDELIEQFLHVEILMGRAISLARKFPEQYSLVERLLDEAECVVEDGPERESVYDLFSIGGSVTSSFPQPTTREFVLETFDPYSSKVSSPEVTGWHSRPLQRRMYACFRESEARLVEAVAKDGMFM